MLPGAATAPSVSAERLRLAEATGERAVAMARAGGPRPREILTAAALRNASVVLQATSGSTNALDPSGGDRGARRDRIRPRGVRPGRTRHAGAGQPQARRRALRRRFPCRRRRAGAVAPAQGSTRPVGTDRQRRDPGRRGGALAGLRGRRGDPAARPAGGRERGDRDPDRLARAATAPRSSSPPPPSRSPRIRARRWCSTRSTTSPRASTIPTCRSRPTPAMVLRNAGPIGAPGMPEAGALADPEEARQPRRQGHGADLRRAHERHRVRHRGAARRARGGGRRTARAGARRRHDPARCRRAPPRPPGRRSANSAGAAPVVAAREAARAAIRGSTWSTSPRPASAATSISWPARIRRRVAPVASSFRGEWLAVAGPVTRMRLTGVMLR